MRKLVALVAGAWLALAVMAAGPAAAQDGEFLALSLGAFNIKDDDITTEGRVEYRMGRIGFRVGPMLGVMFNSDASVYVYGGFYLDLEFGKWVVMPSVAIAAFFDGRDRDKRFGLDLRSGVEVAYRFDNRSRLGIAIHHISNADLIGANPNANSLVVTYAIPFELL